MNSKSLTGSAQQELEQRKQLKIAEIAAVADDLPGVIIIHNRQLEVEYISKRGERELGLSLAEIRKLGVKYHQRFFNPEDTKDYLPKIISLLEGKDTNAIVSFFQQVRRSENDPWAWHLSTIKVLMWDDNDIPLLTITMAFPIDPLHHVTCKVSRLLDENNFLRKHYHDFSKLSEREQEVLRLLCLGKSAMETAEELFISSNTVETHRRNIKKKLGTTSSFELTQYARAFDLI
ncbi:regulatory LuxR family protein [Pontibacter ummariensis]|uniref:Regulatory protein, luxR family n=1 Tax=Pontibacter ummariensis TaxID=1610492 RepID=A0A239I9P8_9BACT|nr:helix-turn-helix transcriptional regulator [Pontibacter ummariensis]PRY09979.1 regulatory LuxR family protein [Pontibacter ummariensis]SNS90058.1 regulatory protein, luxR family [Pontibacter ummariensis]